MVNLYSKDELWADVKGYEGLYQVSTLGKVRRLATTKIETSDTGEVIGVWRSRSYELKITMSKHLGYAVCGLSKGNTTTTHRLHRLVAEAFLPHDSTQIDVHHVDKNTANNCADNLQWLSPEIHQRLYHQMKFKHNR